jgi:hypothetical protein
VAARYAAEKLSYEQQMAQRTVKSAEAFIQQSEKSFPQLRMKAEQAEQEKQAAEDDLAKRSAAAAEAKQRAADSSTEQDKAAAAKAEQERLAAESVVRQKVNNYQRDFGQLERTQDRVKQNQADLAAAQQAIPLKEAAAKDARAIADAARQQALEANRRHAAGQDPGGVAQRIDALIDARLQREAVPASPQVDDAEFLRRATLDISGTIPSYEDVLSFLDDASSDRRHTAIDRLLDDPRYGRSFAQRFCTVTTENGTSTLNQARDNFSDWLAENLNVNRRWNDVVTDMLAAEGQGFAQPAALFTVAYRMNEQPDPALLLGAAGDYFLGLQIQCVQCHDHPFHEWKHEEFWSLAALFGRVRLKGQSQNARELEYLVTDDDVDPKELVRMNGIKYPDQLAGGKIDIPDPVNAGQTLRTVSARFLDGSQPQLPEKGNYRTALARWITDKQNPYFARATVNRLWAHFFGRGLVEPIVNLHPDNEPSHPELLDLLTEEFKRTDYDLKHLVRSIASSHAYQRSSKPVAGNEKDDRLLSHMAVKPLDSYVLIDALSAALRRTPQVGTRRRDDAAVFDTRLPGGDPLKYTHSIPQVLRLMNTKDHVQSNSAVQTVTRGRPPAEAIEHLYLAVLSRRPTSVETREMVSYVSELGDERQGYADVFWVLINSAEFLVNH